MRFYPSIHPPQFQITPCLTTPEVSEWGIKQFFCILGKTAPTKLFFTRTGENISYCRFLTQNFDFSSLIFCFLPHSINCTFSPIQTKFLPLRAVIGARNVLRRSRSRWKPEKKASGSTHDGRGVGRTQDLRPEQYLIGKKNSRPKKYSVEILFICQSKQ